MIEYPISLEWTIFEDRLRALKNSINYERLESNKFTAFRDSDIRYFLRIFPNGQNCDFRGLTRVSLGIELGNVKKIDADFTISIESAKWSYTLRRKYENSNGWGYNCCTIDELFDTEKKFIVDGKLTIKVEGILKTTNPDSEKEMKLLQTIWKYSNNFGDLWNNDFKDCTIFADQKQKTKAHKCVIGHHSSVFGNMLENKFKIRIYDVPFKTVEMFLKHCYNRFHVSEISVEEAMSLLDFAEKYVAEELKGNLEEFLSAKLSPFNLCKIIKCATDRNALKLQNKCLEYFVECLSKKFPISDMMLVDNDFLISVFTKFSCQQNQIKNIGLTTQEYLQIENVGPITKEFRKKKWKTTENFRNLWNIGHGDCIIIVGGKEVKGHKIVLSYHSRVFDAVFKDEFERKAEISDDFSPEIVEMAIKLFYDKKLVPEISFEDSILLYKFAVKYETVELKENLEILLAAKLTPLNLCKIMKCATDENALQLQNLCLESFLECLLKKKFVSNMELLDKNVFVTTIEKFCCQYSKTL